MKGAPLKGSVTGKEGYICRSIYLYGQDSGVAVRSLEASELSLFLFCVTRENVCSHALHFKSQNLLRESWHLKQGNAAWQNKMRTRRGHCSCWPIFYKLNPEWVFFLLVVMQTCKWNLRKTVLKSVWIKPPASVKTDTQLFGWTILVRHFFTICS